MARSAATSIVSTETPAVLGSPGPGRDDDAAQVRGRIVGQRLDAGPVDRVVADDADVRAGGLERLDEVEGERVVVVDDEDHSRPPAAPLSAAPAAVLVSVAVPGSAAPGAVRPGLSPARRELDRPAQRRRLVLGLLELPLGDAPGDDPGAGVDVGLAAAEDRAADRDRRVEVAVVAEVADGAAVQPAALALGRRDELHRADLRGARQRAGREDGAQRVERVELRPQPALDVADEVEDVAVALDLHVLRHGHRARPGDAPEVVAPEVDEHHVLGPLLGVALELLGEELVLGRRGAARPRAGDRVGRQAVALRPGGGAPGSRRRPRRRAVRTKKRYGLGLTRRSAR